MARILIEKLHPGAQKPPDKVGERCTIQLPDVPAEARTVSGFLYWIARNPELVTPIFAALLEVWGPDLGLQKPH